MSVTEVHPLTPTAGTSPSSERILPSKVSSALAMSATVEFQASSLAPPKQCENIVYLPCRRSVAHVS